MKKKNKKSAHEKRNRRSETPSRPRSSPPARGSTKPARSAIMTAPVVTAPAATVTTADVVMSQPARTGPIAVPVGGFDYPRPMFRRRDWTNLDGTWRFAFDPKAEWRSPADIPSWPLEIVVPFAPESQKSGLADTGFHKVCWYQRDFDCAPGEDRVFLNFGAVDYSARVWVNGVFVGSHEGGHTPFSLEIGHALLRAGRQSVVVRAEDDPFDLAKPRGKQDWELEPHSIWYPRTTGIWQTVWLERVPTTYIDSVLWTPLLERWEIGCESTIRGDERAKGLSLRVSLSVDDQLLAEDTYKVIAHEVHRRIALSDPGIDDYRNKILWSPERPTLIQARLDLIDESGKVIDTVHSYTALRSVGYQRDRFMLNGRPYYLRLVLDQGYWPDSLMTAPDSEAFKRDIELVKAMGFNGVRKHQKIEDPRFHYWADSMGLLVWEEMPSAYRFTRDSVERITREWSDVIKRDINHPCIIAWVPFNESWGVPDLPEKLAHQHCVQALFHLTKTLDSSRPVVGNDGWEASATDIIGIHDYDGDPERLRRRYSRANLDELFGRARPGGRMLILDGHPHKGQPILLTEFGGIAVASRVDEETTWGYTVSRNDQELERRYRALLCAVNEIELFAGFCYTQLTDTFQEANGILTADRRPKFPLDQARKATLGIPPEAKDRTEAWAQESPMPDHPPHPQIPHEA